MENLQLLTHDIHCASGEGMREPGRVSQLISGDTSVSPSRKPPLTPQSPLGLPD